MVAGKSTFVVAVMLVGSLVLADAQMSSAAEPPVVVPTETSTATPTPTEPTPTPTTTPPPLPKPPVVSAPVYLPASKVKLRKLPGGTSIVRGKGKIFGK